MAVLAGDRGTANRVTGELSVGDLGTGDLGAGDRGTGDLGAGDRGTGDGATGDGAARKHGDEAAATHAAPRGNAGSASCGAALACSLQRNVGSYMGRVPKPTGEGSGFGPSGMAVTWNI